jgi:hypothetical protein
MHPAGVVSGRWTCTRCGGKQADAPTVKTASIYASDMHHEATS